MFYRNTPLFLCSELLLFGTVLTNLDVQLNMGTNVFRLVPSRMDEDKGSEALLYVQPIQVVLHSGICKENECDRAMFSYFSIPPAWTRAPSG